jgi:ABC-type uncharacterized transport system substrate-binding protein
MYASGLQRWPETHWLVRPGYKLLSLYTARIAAADVIKKTLGDQAMMPHMMRAVGAGIVAAVIVGVACPGIVAAHPHVWVTVKTELLHDTQKNITGFRHHWTFDIFYTSFAIQGLDKDNDGTYSREELKELAEVNVTSLKEFDFFTFPALAGQDLERLEPRDYWLDYKDKMLTLNFTLPLENPVPKAKLKDFQFAVYDPTFYVAFTFADKEPVRIEDGLGECHAEIVKPQAEAPGASPSESLFSSNNALMNFGQQYAEKIRLKCNPSS